MSRSPDAPFTTKARKSSTTRTAMPAAPRADVYERVTAKIIAQLEAGTRPWMQPWGIAGAGGSAPIRPLRHNGVPYRGINTVLLWMEAEERGFTSRYWMTYRQAATMGAQVRKGEKSALVVYANAIEKTEQDENGDESLRRIPFVKGYAVFNADQIDGLPEHYRDIADISADIAPKERIPGAEVFIAACGADIREGGNRAYYQLATDYIGMPPFEAFVSAEAHATTLLHELAHWTRAPHRLNRDLGRKTWGDEGYAREELVAEMASVFLAADLGLTIEPRDDHASYIASWLKVLRDDKRAIFQAATHAEKAAAYLHGLQPNSAPAEAENAGEIEEERAAA
jgi:antirestriction protein ArdC